jgi:hypothetical protein
MNEGEIAPDRLTTAFLQTTLYSRSLVPLLEFRLHYSTGLYVSFPSGRGRWVAAAPCSSVAPYTSNFLFRNSSYSAAREDLRLLWDALFTRAQPTIPR